MSLANEIGHALIPANMLQSTLTHALKLDGEAFDEEGNIINSTMAEAEFQAMIQAEKAADDLCLRVMRIRQRLMLAVSIPGLDEEPEAKDR